MNNKEFLLSIIDSIENDREQDNNWRGTLTSWIKC